MAIVSEKTMKRFCVSFVHGLMAIWVTGTCAWSGEPASDGSATDTAHTISGIVAEFGSGTSDVPVCLCSAATGLPLTAETYQPFDWVKYHEDGTAGEMAIVVSDTKGRFRFDHVPEGKYRLIAQQWTGPYKGAFEVHGTVIRLMGCVDGVVVPRPNSLREAWIALTPPGEGIVKFDQDVGNNETFMFLSTSPPEFDPILGLRAMGPTFFQHLIGVNRMPYGKTTVIGVPDRTLYAFFFAPDNSPGYATVEVPAARSGLVRMGSERFVAGWSDGRKTPPAELAELMDFLEKHSLTASQVLAIPALRSVTYEAYRARMQALTQQLSTEVELPEGRLARIGDLLAVEAYRRLGKTEKAKGRDYD